MAAISAAACVVAAALAAPIAATATSSVATTKPATSIKTSSAVLNGEASPASTDSAWEFEYGATRALGKYTRPVAIGSGTTSVDHKLTHLKDGTTYYFRLIVIQGGYTSSGSYGAILRFKTKHRRH
jgi:hypothetical protein